MPRLALADVAPGTGPRAQEEAGEPSSPLSVLLRVRRREGLPEGFPKGDAGCRLLGRTRAGRPRDGLPKGDAGAWTRDWLQKPAPAAAQRAGDGAEGYAPGPRRGLQVLPAEDLPPALKVGQWADAKGCCFEDGDANKENHPPQLPPREVLRLCSHLSSPPDAAGAAAADLLPPVLATTPAVGPPPGLSADPGAPPGLARLGRGGLSEPPSQPPVLRLNELLAAAAGDCGREEVAPSQVEPPLRGSPAWPSVGSVWHPLGTCRPCAFMFKAVSCANGANCEFCHLCGPGERHRRKRNQKAAKRAVQTIAATAPCSLSPLAPWALSPLAEPWAPCAPLGLAGPVGA